MKTTNKYFYIIVTIAIVVIIITGIQGISQVSQRKQDYTKYMEARKIINESNEHDELKESVEIFNLLEKKYGKNPQMIMDKSKAYYEMGEYEKSLDAMKECFKAEKSLEQDAKIVYLYGRVAYLSGDIKEAKTAMNKAKELGILNSDIKDEEKNFLKKIIEE